MKRNERRMRLSGMTLTEVMVAIFIVLVAMEGFTQLFLRSWVTNGFVLETGLAASAASRAVNDTVSDLRKIRQGDDGDYPIEFGDDFEMTAYINIDADAATERVHYFLENGNFRRGVTNPNATQPVTYPSGDQSVVTLATNIANESSEPVFTYYNDDYPGDTTNNPLSTPIAIRSARLVKVRLVINIDPNRAPDDTNIESFAEFRNLENYVQ